MNFPKLALLLALSLSATALSAQRMQLVVDYETTKKGKPDPGESGTIEFVTDGDVFGMAMNLDKGAPVQIIMDTDARKITTVTEDKSGKSATVLPMMKFGQKELKAFTGDVERTDETKTILGYEARKFIMRDGGTVTEAWIANVPGFSWADFAGAASGRGRASMMAAMPELDGYPNAVALESTTTKKGGKEVMKTTVTSVATGADADLTALSIPDDAVVNDMSAMLKGFGGGR